MIEGKIEEIVLGLIAGLSAVGVAWRARNGNSKNSNHVACINEPRLLKIEEHLYELSEQTAGIDRVLETMQQTQQTILGKLIDGG